MSVGLLASCAGDENTVTQGTGEPATIKLTLSTGSATTKTGGASGTALPTGDGTLDSSTGSSADESKINRISVGLFDGSNNTVSVQEIENPSTSSANSITTTTLATQILVVANAPKGWFSGVTTLSEFQTKQAAILGYTTSTDGNTAYTIASGINSQTATAMPMAGAVQPVTLSSTAANLVAAPLTRFVARIAITNITTSFENAGAYAGATFVPKEIFVYNANTTYNWNNTMPTIASLQSGESTDASNVLFSTLTSYSYLSSGVLSLTGVAPTTPYSNTATELVYLKDPLTSSTTDNPYFFYVFPNTSSDATTNIAKATKLVIKGDWTPSGGTKTTMYYPIIINHGQAGTTFNGNSTTATGTDTQVAANTRYSMKAIIKSIGVTTPGANIDPASVSLSVTVIGWTSSGQTVVFN